MNKRFDNQMQKARDEAHEFNANYPVGTPVRYLKIWGVESSGVDTKTRSEAWAMDCGEACVMVEGVSGGVSLSHCYPLEPTR
jgi:hypothetical protein